MPSFSPQDALAAWGGQLPPPVLGQLRLVEHGLINLTYLVGTPARWVLQWVNPIFDPAVQGDIETLTEHLVSRGLDTPLLVRTDRGETHAADGGDGAEDSRMEPRGVWRLLTYVPGTTLHRLESRRTSEEAGHLVGRFHGALAGWSPRLRAPRRGIHDTPERMAELEQALEACGAHPLETGARRLGSEILRAWERFDGELELPERICHGDLKISNLRFDSEGNRGVCLIDLDTVGPLALACEMGDAWRSWCNRAGEDEPEASCLDLELFEASARGWVAALGEQSGELRGVERRSLVPGIERICLELAARFCADSVRNSYFREDRSRFPRAGEHNLLRARGQLALAASARELRPRCEAVLRHAFEEAGQ
ncbi:MAG: aminoglycoside phosphotransferase family protein [Holophagales bacterium]|nr:aminoglycoside phosphotransferase family protein [Holophagales bacterium]